MLLAEPILFAGKTYILQGLKRFLLPFCSLEKKVFSVALPDG